MTASDLIEFNLLRAEYRLQPALPGKFFGREFVLGEYGKAIR
jgi:hypothetical protein